jgi:hypothetical protein
MEPPPYVVRISGTKSGHTSLNGTGFIVDKVGHVVTCWHVVSQADEITVHLPHIEPWRYCVCKKLEIEDLVVLESIVPPSSQKHNALLHPDWKRGTNIGDPVTIWGFSAFEHYTAPQRLDCKISGFSGRDGRIGLNGDVNLGDSGAPVVNTHGQVIGIAQARDANRNGQAMAIPISLLFKIFQPQIHEQNAYLSVNCVLQEGEEVLEPTSIRKKLKMLQQLYSEGMISEEINTEYTRKILDRHLLMGR